MGLVSEAMSRAVATVRADASVGTARAVADRAQARHVLVTDEGNLVGILCMCDLSGASPEDRVCDVMSVPVLTVAPATSLEEAADTMSECEVGCLPVACGGLILGTVTHDDLERAGLRLARRSGCDCAGGSGPPA